MVALQHISWKIAESESDMAWPTQNLLIMMPTEASLEVSLTHSCYNYLENNHSSVLHQTY